MSNKLAPTSSQVVRGAPIVHLDQCGEEGGLLRLFSGLRSGSGRARERERERERVSSLRGGRASSKTAARKE